MNNSEELDTIITNATNKLNEARALNSSDGVQIAYEAALAAVNFFSSPCEYSNSGNKYYRHEFARNLKTLREYRKNEEKLRCASILANEKSDEKHFSTLRTIRIETMKLATALNAAKLYADKNSAISYNEKAEYLCNKAVEAFTQYCTLEYNSNEQITHEFRIAKYNRLAECWYEFNSPEDNGRILREKTSRDDRLFEYDSDGDRITIRVELPNVCNNVSVFCDHDGKWFSNFYKLGTVEGDKFFNKFAEFDAKITAERIVEKAVKYAAESKAIARNTSENGKRTITKYSANADGTETWYDFSGKLIRSKDSDGLETGYEYNANGKLIHEKNSNKEEVWYEYDADGNEIHEKYSTGYEEWYDAYGNPVHEKWSNGDEVFLDRDANGDLVHKKILPEGEEIWYTYNGGHIINSESSRKEYYWKEENGITVYCETEYGEYKEADDFFPTNYINDAFSI